MQIPRHLTYVNLLSWEGILGYAPSCDDKRVFSTHLHQQWMMLISKTFQYLVSENYKICISLAANEIDYFFFWYD